MPTIPRLLRSAALLLLSATPGLAAPSITSITPSSGSTQGSTAITISGSGFGTSAALASVSVSGTSMLISSITNTQIVASTPAGEGTAKQLTVTVAGQTSNAATFNYLPPAINSFTPATFPTSGGTTLTLVGSNFGLTPGVTAGSTNFPITSKTHSSIICTVPAGQGSSIPVVVTTAGQISNSISISYSPPAITSISPTTGSTAGNTSVTITGSNFGTTSTVRIGGNNAPATSSSHTQLVVNSPAGDGTNQAVVVTTAGQTSNSAQFNYLPPSITGITPGSAGTAGGSLITLTGSNFGLSPKVDFNGGTITPNSSTHTQAVFLLPAGEGTNVPVSLTASGQTSSPVTFNYNAPTITTISPASGPTLGGSVITINGTNFGLSGSATIGGVAAPTTSGGLSHNKLIVTVPSGQGTGKPVVVTVLGRTSNSANFDYQPPSISGITYGSAPTAGGSILTITGSNFGTSGTVSVGGQNATITPGGYSHTMISCTLPPGQGVNVPVVVTVSGSSASGSITYDPPTLTGISPSTGPTSGGTLITLTGSNFGTAPTVTMNGSGVTVQSSNHSQVIFQLPAGQGTNKQVRVTAGGQQTAAVNFSYATPQITEITADSYPTAGGTTLTLTGSNFVTTPVVSVGGTVAPLAAVPTHTQILCTLPAGQGKNQAVTVTTAGQVSNTEPLHYDEPEILSITPANASTQGGTVITLTGKNFGLTGSVTIGGQNAAITSGGYSHTAITCTLPAGQGANLPVVVTSADRSSTSVSFSYNPPAITGISPATGPTAGGSLITLTGSNFGTNPVVLFNGASVTPESSTHLQLIFQLPAGEGNNLPVVVSAGGQTSSSTSFIYGAPALTGISAASVPTAGGTQLTLTGSNFGLNPVVHIGSSVAPLVPAASGHSQIVCTLPSGQGVGKSVTVTVAGTDSNPLNLDYDAPVITGITPASAGTSGGTTITINGLNFGLTNRSVILGGQTITQFSSASHTQIVCTLPAGQGSNAPVQVSVDGRLSGSSSFAYQPPALSGITPSSGPTSGGTRITLTGSDFGVAPSVSIGGRSAPLAFSSHTMLQVDMPAGEGADQQVIVTAGDQSSAALDFDYQSPAITGITAGSYPTSGGTVITLTGSNFGINKTVTIGGQTALIQPGSTHAQALCILPAGQGTHVPVILSSGGQSSAAAFINYDAPSITSISPGTGPTSGAVPITINGLNFGVTPQVTIGGKSAPNSSIAHNRIIVTLPAGGGPGKQVTVTTAGQVSNAALFDYDGDTFTNWSESIAWNGIDSSAGADPRHTGWKNCLAYALGVDPTTATGGEIASRTPPVRGMPAVSRDAMGRLQVSFWRRRGGSSPDLVYQVQFAGSPDANPWDGPAPDPQVEVVDSAWEFCTFTDTAPAGSRRFGRLKVELASPP